MTLFSDTRNRPILNIVAGIGLVTLAACSSGAPAATATARTDTPPSAAASAAASDSAVSSEPADNGGTGGGTDWCLNTVDEVVAAIDVESPRRSAPMPPASAAAVSTTARMLLPCTPCP